MLPFAFGGQVPRGRHQPANLGDLRRRAAHGDRVHRGKHGHDRAAAAAARLLSRHLRHLLPPVLAVRAARARRAARAAAFIAEEIGDQAGDGVRILILQPERLGREVVPRRDIEHVDERLDLLRKADVAREDDLVRVAVGRELRVLLGKQALDAIEHVRCARLAQAEDLGDEEAVVRHLHHVLIRSDYDARLGLGQVGQHAEEDHVFRLGDGDAVHLQRLVEEVERLALRDLLRADDVELDLREVVGLVGDVLARPLEDDRDDGVRLLVLQRDRHEFVIDRAAAFATAAELRSRGLRGLAGLERGQRAGIARNRRDIALWRRLGRWRRCRGRRFRSRRGRRLGRRCVLLGGRLRGRSGAAGICLRRRHADEAARRHDGRHADDLGEGHGAEEIL